MKLANFLATDEMVKEVHDRWPDDYLFKYGNSYYLFDWALDCVFPMVIRTGDHLSLLDPLPTSSVMHKMIKEKFKEK